MTDPKMEFLPEEDPQQDMENYERYKAAMYDYAELWIAAQRAHKDIFEAALRDDWIEALKASDQLRSLSKSMGDWFQGKISSSSKFG